MESAEHALAKAAGSLYQRCVDSENPAQETPTIPVAPKRLLIVDHHPIFRHGLKDLIQKSREFLVCGEAASAKEAMEAVRTQRPDIVMTDIALPGINGIELIKSILAEYPRLLVVVVTGHEESAYALRALRAGARGCLNKREAVEQMVEALYTVVGGNISVSALFRDKIVFRAILSDDADIAAPMDKLSSREWDVLGLVAKAKSTREIAQGMGLSVKTIETHRAHLKEKLGLKDCDELSAFATEWLQAGGMGRPEAAA
jgi:DNA-binding NarL/FixJ family response regulator